MRKIGMTLSRDTLDAPLARHFGKAKWAAAHVPGGATLFMRNEGLTGAWVGAALRDAGCTDVILDHAGPGATKVLGFAGIALWGGEPGVPASALVERLLAGELRRLDLVPLGLPGAGRRAS